MSDSNLSQSVPTIISAMPVVAFSRIDERHRATGACVHIRSDIGVLGPAWGIAICESARGEGYFLYRCEDDWMPVTDTWHESLEDAKHQAEFEYAGVERTWQRPPE
jgi:hypothetical protein